ncbi:hypothetical protein DXX93_12460 [Thalassotalea euphylliae]|uniref:Peptidase M14 domain-containing protein n=1 Tax=Thalassotalea euphylliae TaxID=1655234 RepID=A0A3E0TS31_9GAMM|nr:M14 family metallopeptidase [Thalassotalea euphylliae]REL27294.1 hypothetical protein DXX93_12460 [Thalassotalea euphylliae]
MTIRSHLNVFSRLFSIGAAMLLLSLSSLAYAQKLDQPQKQTQQQRDVYSFAQDGLYFSNQAKGTRLNKVTRLAQDHYQMTISSAFVPTNTSSFFAFQLWSLTSKKVKLSLKYTEHKHRYVPKFSVDRRQWQPISGLIMSEGDTVATFDVDVSPTKLWLAAQEIESAQDTYDWLDALMAGKPFLKKQAVGKSVQGQDLWMVAAEQEKVKPSLVLIARQHPPEIPGGTFAFKAFYEEVVGNSELAQLFRTAFNIYTFPLLNPDGADGGFWRHNANGFDLNRDWQAFSQPETRAVRDFVTQKVAKEGKQLVFGVDFHTSFNGPYLLILNEQNEANANTAIIPQVIKNAQQNAPIMAQYRRREQNLPYCYNWFFNEFGAEAVTYEEGDETDRRVIYARAKLYAQSLMKAMLSEQAR